jgi:cyclopropane fatty-acyl-phospholipid synthase-like methyltransferase
MANWLTREINKYLSTTESVLDLCCGNGIVSDGFLYSEITGVDVGEEYLSHYQSRLPNSKTKIYDLSKISSSEEEVFSENKYDNVLCIDGVEHLEKEQGIALIEKIEQMAIKRVIIFTPENVNNPDVPTLNTPKNTWGISSGDEWQIHRSAFPRTFFQERGYKVIQCNKARNVYDGTYYYEMLYILEK